MEAGRGHIWVEGGQPGGWIKPRREVGQARQCRPELNPSHRQTSVTLAGQICTCEVEI